MNKKAREHLSKGIMRVMRTSPFYTTIIFGHNIVEDEEVNGMSIDGEDIRYNPEGILTQTPAELAEYLKHMAMHIAFKHHIRGNEMKPRMIQKCNEAGIPFDRIFDQSADLCINSLLRKENPRIWNSEEFKSAPIPGSGKFEDFEDNESLEQYFPKVLSIEETREKENGNGPGNGEGPGSSQNENGSGAPDNQDQKKDENQSQSNQPKSEKDDQQNKQEMNFGMVKPAKGDSSEADDRADEMIAAAINQAKEAGEQTGSVKGIIAENEKPVKVDWRGELSQFFERQCKGKMNYRHVNRRLWDKHIIFPTNKDKSPKRIIFLVDVSGSMMDECVVAVYNHIEEVIKAKRGIIVELVPFDAYVFKDNIVEFTTDNIPIKNSARSRIGWGGTKFVPAAKYAEKRAAEEDVSGVVMLTDLLPCDTREFCEMRPGIPWLILSVLEFQFSGHPNACRPEWARIIEIEP